MQSPIERTFMVVVVLALLSTCVACSTKKASTNDTPSDAGTSDRVDEADGSTTADQRAQDATESDAFQSVDARYPVAKHAGARSMSSGLTHSPIT